LFQKKPAAGEVLAAGRFWSALGSTSIGQRAAERVVAVDYVNCRLRSSQ
jgi:hypothetical protein